MRKDMTIEELINGIKKDMQKGLEDFSIDDELKAKVLLNVVRTVLIEGIIDGRDEEVFGYMSGCTPEDRKEFRMMLEEEDSDDPEWKAAVQALLGRLSTE